MYTCFVRNWYKWETIAKWGSGVIGNTRAKRLVPNPGARRTVMIRVNTEQEARDYCQKYNDTHKPGPLSRKCEYTSNF